MGLCVHCTGLKMASNFLQQLPGFNKLPFGWRKDQSQSSDSDPPGSSPLTGPTSYRARKSISESHHPGLDPRMSMSLINKGLLNPTGENNCFLNSAVQVNSSLNLRPSSLFSSPIIMAKKKKNTRDSSSFLAPTLSSSLGMR